METTATHQGNAPGFRIIKSPPDILSIHDKMKINVEAGHSRLITKTPGRLTLETIFENWSCEEYDAYDWGELDKPAGEEMI